MGPRRSRSHKSGFASRAGVRRPVCWDWRLGVDWLPAELDREARRGAVEAISQQIGLGGRAVADAAAHTDRLGESRRDVRLWLDDEKVIASNEARTERLWLLSGRRRARRRRSLCARIGN